MELYDEILRKSMTSQFLSDCSRCSGLCCRALYFSKMDGFPEDKKAGVPCCNLQEDYRCRIHKELAERCMKGCIGYDCFGAGPKVAQDIYKSKAWKVSQDLAEETSEVYLIIFQLYQIRFYLSEVRTLIPCNTLWKETDRMLEESNALCNCSVPEILTIDLGGYRDKANAVLKQACNMIQKVIGGKKKKIPSEFLGKSLKNRDMSGADLSMRLLIAADFAGGLFDGTIFLGADTRDTNFCDADLRKAVFLTQGQVNSAKGNQKTKLPEHLIAPVTWRA